ncbi:GH3 family domain-containing protein [Anaerotalea alkaliphila]|uniref:GH3 auxin-responsive promoter family protein n=1 Tax=Anaerotalea alkaliphila TaxID=2662126 RepID=A0A7X5HWW9_9FIRM|nr:GH3 auxin-responsive promoter family protein [Anaerotalea alkaliphila]NDL68108.1 GH3 auxin-responsive promoter family protein [Anaerotalea alkaliphila]
MTFEEKIKALEPQEVWEEYCGFLDLDMESYMQIQNRLMLEQLSLWEASPLGRQMLSGRKPASIRDFREQFPLTSYGDYADILLMKRDDMLPEEPVVWIETTWEGGTHPVKVAPYTKGMVEIYTRNLFAALILSTGTGRGNFNVEQGDTILYGLAPLPYATGLIPVAVQDEMRLEFLPPVREAVNMSFGERNKKGFKMGLSKGIDYFFGMGSVAYFVSLSIAAIGGGQGGSGGGGIKKLLHCSPSMLARLLAAKSRCRKENRDLKPKDLFKLKSFICAGTDNGCYKDDLEDLWGVRPLELFMGTEPSCMGVETWNRNGMYFFPDTCFYEFIPEAEMYKSLDNPDYQPKTCLMDEVVAGEKYELVISVLKGGAFMRYRVGDTYRCMGLSNKEDQTCIPRFQYIDRIPTVIDIAGFTRITENSIRSVVELSGLQVQEWMAVKEYNENNRPYMHMFVEMEEDSLASHAVSREILKEHLGVYFKYVDQDYTDLKRILGMDPLAVTILRCGTFAEYERRTGNRIRRINPSSLEVGELLRLQQESYAPKRRCYA